MITFYFHFPFHLIKSCRISLFNVISKLDNFFQVKGFCSFLRKVLPTAKKITKQAQDYEWIEE
jgi:hypothetical protein